MPKGKIQCDFNCLECPFPDCKQGTRAAAKQAVARRRKREKFASDSWNYAYMANVPEPDYTTSLITRTMDKDELEKMLVAQYGDKLESVRRDARGKAKANAGGR